MVSTRIIFFKKTTKISGHIPEKIYIFLRHAFRSCHVCDHHIAEVLTVIAMAQFLCGEEKRRINS